MPCVTEVKGRRAKENAQPHFSCCFPSRMWRGCPLIKSTSGCPTWPTCARSLLLWREIFSILSRSSVKFVCVCGGDEREIMNLFHDSNGSFPLSAIVLTVKVGGQSYRSSGDCICFSVCFFLGQRRIRNEQDLLRLLILLLIISLNNRVALWSTHILCRV